MEGSCDLLLLLSCYSESKEREPVTILLGRVSIYWNTIVDDNAITVVTSISMGTVTNIANTTNYTHAIFTSSVSTLHYG